MLWLIALLACEPEEDPCVAAAAFDPSLTVSEGMGPFRALSDGDALASESGPQGGEHVWVSLRTTGLDPGAYALVGDDRPGPKALVGLYDDLGAEQGFGSIARVPWEGDAAQAETTDLQVFLSYEWPRGGEVELVAEAEDACGTTVTHRVRVTLR